MRVNDAVMHTHISTYAHTHTHVLMPKKYMHHAELWVCGKQIAIQSQINHTFELGPSLQEQVSEVSLAGGWDSMHSLTYQRASWKRSKLSVCLTQDIHREI